NGHRIIANSQAAAQEIWLAARSGGFHYRWDVARAVWVDTRSGEDLRVALSRLIEIELGVSPTLSL
ncbi:MAG: iron donor protein CyaY, partial [Burkholderiaceae bacterium]